MADDVLRAGPGAAAPREGATAAQAAAHWGPAAPRSARPLALNTFRENVILLPRGDPVLRPERLAGLRKVEVRANGTILLATVMICDDPALVGPGEVGLPEPTFRRLCAQAGDPVEVAPARPPRPQEAGEAQHAGATPSAAA